MKGKPNQKENLQVISTPQVKVMPMEMKVKRIMRTVSELPRTEGLPINVAAILALRL